MTNDTEGRLRDAMGATADRVQTDADGSLARIRTRTIAARRRRRNALSVAAVVVVLIPVAVGIAIVDRRQTVSSGPAHPGTTATTSEPTTTSRSSTTAVTPTTGPSVPSDVLWPDGAGTDERLVAHAFVTTILGYDKALVGQPNGDEVPVMSATESGGSGNGVSTLDMKEVDGKWYVVGAHSESVIVDSPKPFATVTAPVTVSGRGRGFEAVLVAEVHDGDGGNLGQAHAAGGCCDTLESFSVDVSLSVPQDATGFVLLHNTTGAEFATPDFAVVPVQFASATTTVTVYFTARDQLVPELRAVPKTTGVLKASVQQELAGPTGDESAVGLMSPFSSATARVALDVNLTSGAATVDFDASLATVLASPDAAQVVAQLDATIFHFPSVTSIEYRMGGSCDRFWSWLGRSCHVESRP